MHSLEGNACDVEPFLEDEVNDYRQGYADGVDQVNQESGTPTPEITQELYVFF